MSDVATDASAHRPERRKDPARRARIEQALIIVRPFFEAESRWGGHSLDHMAYRRLRAEMPELTEVDVHLLVVVASRIFAPRPS
ncbi:MAG: hypothetical protein KDG52_05485 [Rhodocyclaceae bacterium]|nr:hypothetical protein [Rhodocyclaceae bacterium]